MSVNAETILITELTKPLAKGQAPDLAPLRTYLQEGHPVPHGLRNLLIDFMSPVSKHRRILKLLRRPGRPPSKERRELHQRAYERIKELEHSKMNYAFATK